MAYPTIVYNNSTGSATAASGAGPSTALSGTSASFSGAVFTLDGSPDLSGVATDGSHCLWALTNTGRQMFTINAVDNTAKTVTVDDTPTATVTSGITWGLGGKRNSIFDTQDRTQVMSSDLNPGWTVDIEHTGTNYSYDPGSVGNATLNIDGNTTDGYITIKSSSATRPILEATGSNGSIRYIFQTGAIDYCRFENLDFFFNRTNSSNLGGPFFINHSGNAQGLSWINCIFRQGTGGATGTAKGIDFGRNPDHCLIKDCVFRDLAKGIEHSNAGGTSMATRYIGNHFDGCTEAAIDTWHQAAGIVLYNFFDQCALGVRFNDSVATEWTFIGNVFYGSTSHDIDIGNSFAQSGMFLRNNIHQNCGGYCVDALAALPEINSDHNIYYNATSGIAPLNTMSTGSNDLTTDPGLTDPANDDITISSTGAAKGAGFLGSMPSLGLTGYPDIGALQRQETGGGGGTDAVLVPQGLHSIDAGITA